MAAQAVSALRGATRHRRRRQGHLERRGQRFRRLDVQQHQRRAYSEPTSGGATVAPTVTYLLLVVAIVLGVLVLDESVTGFVLGGIALVLAGLR